MLNGAEEMRQTLISGMLNRTTKGRVGSSAMGPTEAPNAELRLFQKPAEVPLLRCLDWIASAHPRVSTASDIEEISEAVFLH